jgi:hypothetical protein
MALPNAASARQGLLAHRDRAAAAFQPAPEETEVQDALGGVLCRCTGYRKIVAGGDGGAGARSIPTCTLRLASRMDKR